MKQKLVESFQKDWKTKDYKPEKISLTEKNTHISLKEGRFDALVAYKLPIWKLDQKNFNERIYPKVLAEKVVKENKVTVVLDNHPDDKDNPGIKEIIAIGKNPSIEKGILYAECYFIDKFISEKVERATDLGFFFEQSSSGYGELEGDTVIAETYDLERYFDLLLSDSSYDVSFGENDKLGEANNKIVIKEIKNKENDIMGKTDKVISKEDKLIKLSLENKLREASKIEDLKERYAEFASVMEYFTDFDDADYAADLKETVEKELKEIQVKIDEFTEKGKELDKVVEEKETSFKALKEEKSKVDEQLARAIEELDKGKEVYITLKDLYENKVAEMHTMVDPDDYIALVKEFEKVVEAKKEDSDKEDDEKGKEKKDGSGPNGKGDGPGKGKADGSGKDDDPDKEDDDKDEKKKRKEAKDDDDDKKKDDVKDDKKVSDKEDDKDSKKDDKEDVDKDKKDDDDKDEKKKSKKESSFKLVKKIIDEKRLENLNEEVVYVKKHPDLNIELQSDDIVDYYKDLVSRYGESVADFKDSFLATSTLTEAQTLYFKLRPVLNERTKMPSTARRGIVDRTLEETRKTYNEKHNLTEEGSLKRLKSDKDWI